MKYLANILQVSWQGVRGASIRSILTLLALAASVVGLVTVTAASASVDETITERAVLSNGRLGTYLIGPFAGSAGIASADRVAEDVGRLAPSEKVAVGYRLDQTRLSLGSSSSDVSVYFTTAALRTIRPFVITAGTWLPDKSGTSVARVVLNEEAASGLTSPVGQEALISDAADSRSLAAVVIGVVNDGSSQPSAYVSAKDANDLLERNPQDLTTELFVSSPALTIEALSARLTSLGTFVPIPDSVNVRRTDTVEQLEGEADAASGAFRVVGILALIAGVLAVINVGLSAVRERAGELVLRRALGASRVYIATVMIVETLMVALPASVVSVALAAFVYPGIAAQFASPYGVQAPPFPILSAVLGLALGTTAGLVGGLVPVVLALRLKPVAALRGA